MSFYVSERGRYFPDDSEDKGRLLSAGYHNIMGYYRDDLPLMQLILDDNGKRELDRLWNEFDYIAAFSARTWTQYYFNQSGEVFGKGDESGSDRPTDHAVTDTAVIFKMRDVYLAKAAADPTNDPVAAEAIRDHFNQMNATLRSLEKERAESEPKQLEALLQFAERAYRRPLTHAERADLLAYYHQDRTQNQSIPRRSRSRCDYQRADGAGFPLPSRYDRRANSLFFQSGVPYSSPENSCPRRALIQLRPGEPLELFPLGQHAR